MKHEVKASPFSAEALLSRPNPKPQQHLPPSSHHDLVKIAPITALTAAATGKGLASSSSPYLPSHDKAHNSSSRASPWHSPVPPSSQSFGSLGMASAASLGLGVQHRDKPAIPVSPVVREDKNSRDQLMSSMFGAGGLLGSLAAAVTTSTLSSMMPSTYSMTNVTSSASQQSIAASMAAAAANPYLALMMNPKAGGAVPQPPPPVSGYPGMSSASHLMDPATSAYYAALYSQQMYGAAGLSPYAGLGAMGAGRLGGAPAPAPPPPPPPPGAAGSSSAAMASALAGLDPLQAQALQAMLARSAAGSGSPAANPYAGYPGIPGFPPTGYLPPRTRD
jgi:hypothetical protein